MRVCLRFAVVLLAATALCAAADPSLMRLIMPEARLISGFNFSQVLASPIGQFALSEMQGESPEFQKFVATTGFDPRRDLREVLIASAGGPGATPSALVLIRADFDPSRVVDLAKKHGAAMRQYKGVPVLTGGPSGGGINLTPNRQQKTEGWVAFLENSIVALGDAASVRGAIDRRGTGSSLHPRLAARVNELSGLYDFWGVSMIPATEWAGAMPSEQVGGAIKGDVFRAIEEASGGIRLGNEIEIAGEAVTRSEKDATALADVARFLMGLVTMNQSDPKAAEVAKFLQSMELKTDGNTVRMSLRIPEAEIEKMILSAKQQRQNRQAGGIHPAMPRTPREHSSDVIIHSSPKDMGTVVIKQ